MTETRISSKTAAPLFSVNTAELLVITITALSSVPVKVTVPRAVLSVKETIDEALAGSFTVADVLAGIVQSKVNVLSSASVHALSIIPLAES